MRAERTVFLKIILLQIFAETSQNRVYFNKLKKLIFHYLKISLKTCIEGFQYAKFYVRNLITFLTFIVL